MLKAAHEQIQTVSWYILLDFAQYLDQYLHNVWQAILDPQQETNLTNTAEVNLLNALKNTVIGPGLVHALTRDMRVPPETLLSPLGTLLPSLYTAANVKGSLYEALKAIVGWKERLEAATGAYDRQKMDATQRGKPDPTWPDFLFPFADPEVTALQVSNGVAPLDEQDEVDSEVSLEEKDGTDEAHRLARQADLASVDKLVAFVVRALPKEANEPAPALPLAAQPRLDTREGWFVMRCVFERPNCGPLEPPVVSEPTPAVPVGRVLRPRCAGAAHPHRPADRYFAGWPAEVRQEHRLYDQ